MKTGLIERSVHDEPFIVDLKNEGFSDKYSVEVDGRPLKMYSTIFGVRRLKNSISFSNEAKVDVKVVSDTKELIVRVSPVKSREPEESHKEEESREPEESHKEEESREPEESHKEDSASDGSERIVEHELSDTMEETHSPKVVVWPGSSHPVIWRDPPQLVDRSSNWTKQLIPTRSSTTMTSGNVHQMSSGGSVIPIFLVALIVIIGAAMVLRK